MKFKGTNYNKELTVKEIAKLVRQFVRREFKDCKFSVTSTVTSMTIELINSPQETRKAVKGEEFLKEFTAYGHSMYDKIENFVESYNFDDCNSIEDYFFVNFYKDIRL